MYPSLPRPRRIQELPEPGEVFYDPVAEYLKFAQRDIEAPLAHQQDERSKLERILEGLSSLFLGISAGAGFEPAGQMLALRQRGELAKRELEEKGLERQIEQRGQRAKLSLEKAKMAQEERSTKERYSLDKLKMMLGLAKEEREFEFKQAQEIYKAQKASGQEEEAHPLVRKFYNRDVIRPDEDLALIQFTHPDTLQPVAMAVDKRELARLGAPVALTGPTKAGELGLEKKRKDIRATEAETALKYAQVSEIKQRNIDRVVGLFSKVGSTEAERRRAGMRILTNNVPEVDKYLMYLGTRQGTLHPEENTMAQRLLAVGDEIVKKYLQLEALRGDPEKGILSGTELVDQALANAKVTYDEQMKIQGAVPELVDVPIWEKDVSKATAAQIANRERMQKIKERTEQFNHLFNEELKALLNVQRKLRK